jgi:hypothetical protein
MTRRDLYDDLIDELEHDDDGRIVTSRAELRELIGKTQMGVYWVEETDDEA